MAIGGIFGLIATQLLFAVPLQYTTPVYYSLLMSLTTVLVLVLSLLFLREVLTKYKIGGVILSITSAALIILGRKSGGITENNMLGILLSFLAALSYALYIIVTRNVSEKNDAITVTKWTFLFSAAFLIPFGITELPNQEILLGNASATAILELAFALVFATAIGFLLMPVGLKYVKTTA